jgi:hypothetical protein
MNAEQMRAYREVVTAYAELLVAFRSNVRCMIAIHACYAAFGCAGDRHSAAAQHARVRIQHSFRRTAERMARCHGWTGESWFTEAPTPMRDGQLVMTLEAA